MQKLGITTDSRSMSERCRLRMTSLMLMTSAASVVLCYGNNVTSFKPLRKLSLMPGDFRPHYTQLYQVEKLKAQILRGLNLTSVPEPPTKKPPQPIPRILNRLPVPPNHPHQPPSAIVWAEPVDRRRKMADRLLFRVSNQRKISASINRVSLLLRLRSSRHSKCRHRKRPKAKESRQKVPHFKGKGVQNDQQKRSSKNRSSSRQKKKSRSRRKKSRRVKVLVQTLSAKSGKFKRVAVQRVVVDRKFSWVKLPIPVSVVLRAVQSLNQSLVLRVRCKRCQKGGVSIDSAVSWKKSRMKNVDVSSDLNLNPNRPYLIIFASRKALAPRTVPTPSRSARHVDGLCPPPTAAPTSCCAERLHVTFRDLGWDHWIVSPEGFTTALCGGVCQEPSDLHTAPFEGDSRSGPKEALNNKRLSLVRKRGEAIDTDAARDSGSIDSCHPQDRSSLGVIYYTDRNTLTHAVIPELLTHTCSCVKK